MSSAAFQIAVIVFLILLNGFFAMSETALVSSRKARLRQRAEEGDGGHAPHWNSRTLPTASSPRCRSVSRLLGSWPAPSGGDARRAAGRHAARRASAGPLRGTHRLLRSGGGDYLPFADPRRAGAQASRAQRCRGSSLPRVRADSFRRGGACVPFRNNYTMLWPPHTAMGADLRRS